MVSPPPKQAAAAAAAEETPTNFNLSQDSSPLQVAWSNLTNPNVDYPHKRVDCGVHNFDNKQPELFCPKCYCAVCDIPASNCKGWKVHCQEQPKKKAATTEEVTVVDNADLSTAARSFQDIMHQYLQGQHPGSAENYDQGIAHSVANSLQL